MDRLICGDVDSAKPKSPYVPHSRRCRIPKQVAVLVPTTLLVQQHFETFTERLKDSRWK